ncbi:molybdenum ABC transporter permease [Mucilaginibacter defluvii]|uniref:molybdenum ABC transporter permease n=1 Tax=Mucilaginibacter defluvii TaxID=1196019 RepID=UPI0031E95937
MVLILGIILTVVGYILRYQVNRRKFYRRNAAGVELFKTYAGYRVTTKVEGLLKLIGFVLIFAGLFFIAVHFFNNNMARHYRDKAAKERSK